MNDSDELVSSRSNLLSLVLTGEETPIEVGTIGEVLSVLVDDKSVVVKVEEDLLVELMDEGVVFLNITGVGRLFITAFPCESISSTCGYMLKLL